MESGRVLCELRVRCACVACIPPTDPHPPSPRPRLRSPRARSICSLSVKAPVRLRDCVSALATLMGLGHALAARRGRHRYPRSPGDESLVVSHPGRCATGCSQRGSVRRRVSRHGRGPQRLTPNLVMPPEAFCANITEPTVLLGTGVEVYRGVWEETLGNLAIFPPPWLGMPCSVEVGALALTQAIIGHGGIQSGAHPTLCAPLGSGNQLVPPAYP